MAPLEVLGRKNYRNFFCSATTGEITTNKVYLKLAMCYIRQTSNGVACLFCQIINKEIPAEIVSEDEQFLVIKDIKPKAPVHFLAIPKKHIASVNDLTDSDKDLIGALFLAAKKVAQDAGLLESGYRLILNTGQNAGQTIAHLHLHILGGKTLSWS